MVFLQIKSIHPLTLLNFHSSSRRIKSRIVMSSSNFNLASFSLSEILISMLIGIITIGFALYCLSYFQIYFEQFHRRIDQQNQMVRTEQLLWHDIHRFSMPNLNPQDSSFTLSSPLNQVHYEFKQNQLLRNDLLLLSKFEQLAFYYEGKLVHQGRFDAIALTVHFNSKSLRYFFSLPKSVQLYAP